MEAPTTKALIFLAIVGSCAPALVQFDPIIYSNLIARRPEFPIQPGPEVAATGIYAPEQGFVVYNVPRVGTDVRTIPTAVFANGKPGIAHIPTTYNYYGTPIYDFRFPFNPVASPGSKLPPTPGFVPRPETPEPSDDDGIEKLDEKVEPALDPPGGGAGGGGAAEATDDEDDSIAIEAA